MFMKRNALSIFWLWLDELHPYSIRLEPSPVLQLPEHTRQILFYVKKNILEEFGKHFELDFQSITE